VLKLAETIASKSASSLVTAKKAVNASSELPLTEGMNFERSIFYPLMSTKGAAEGVTAFVSKRKPNFKGI
jgi:enoyl-CoA hydratase/carnithine racemase